MHVFQKIRKHLKKSESLVDVLTTRQEIDLSAPRHRKLGNFFLSHSNIYQQQVQSLQTAEEIHQENQAEKLANRNMGIALASASFALVGFVYPVANLFSLLGILHINYIALKNAYNSIVTSGRLNVDALCVAMLPMIILQRYFFLMSLTSIIYAGYYRILITIKNNTTKKTIDIFKEQPRTVWIPLDPEHPSEASVVEVPLSSLQSGDTVIVYVGQTIPVDGYITEGAALVDQHLLTGESQPTECTVGDPVFALTTVLSGQIWIQIDKAGPETTAAQIGHILNQTIEQKTDMQLRVEALTERSIGPTLALSGLLLPFLGPLASLSVLYAHPKYRLLLPTSLSIFSHLSLAAQTGILLKDSQALETLTRVDTIVFDKTGTLTQEQPYIEEIYTLTEAYDTDDVLKYAAAAEDRQTHPVARAILEEAQARQLGIPAIDEAEYKVGYGLTVRINRQIVRVGSLRFIEETGVGLPQMLQSIQSQCAEEGCSLILVGLETEAESLVIGAIKLSPTIRPEAQAVIARLRRQGCESIYIISGDHEAPTRQLAQELNISNYFAETLPQNKSEIIEQLQQSGKTVCYVGDGINDSIALQQADVSISLQGASSIAIDTAQIILMDGTLEQLNYLFTLAHRFEANMKTATSLVLGPSIFTAIGALCFGFSMSSIFVLGLGSFSVGMVYSLWPLLNGANEITRELQCDFAEIPDLKK